MLKAPKQTHNAGYSIDNVMKSQTTYGRRVEGTLAKPEANFFRIFRILESIMTVCERSKIPVWLDYGTLLGCMRERQVILWDYDGDVGMMIEDRERFYEAFGVEQQAGRIPDTLKVDKEYYHDNGCLAVYFDGHQDDICDIIWYESDGEFCSSLQSEYTLTTYPCSYNYTWKYSDIFPLKDHLFLGHRVSIPNNWELPLIMTYGENWRVPLMKKETYIVEKFHVPAIQEARTVEGVDTHAAFMALRADHGREPMVLRQTKLLATSEEQYAAVVKIQEAPIFGYSSTLTWEPEEKTPEKAWQLYKQHRLPFNVVDSPVDHGRDMVLDEKWLAECEDRMPTSQKWYATYVLTNAPAITQWHQDPTFRGDGVTKGDPGGWMKMLSGTKIWWFVVEEDIQALYDRGYTRDDIATMSIGQMLEVEDCFLWGKIRVVEAHGGDLIWFPANCLHKVITLEDTYGWGGYL